jgi:hypothetical protein
VLELLFITNLIHSIRLLLDGAKCKSSPPRQATPRADGCKAVDSAPPTCNHAIHEFPETTFHPSQLVAPLNWAATGYDVIHLTPLRFSGGVFRFGAAGSGHCKET